MTAMTQAPQHTASDPVAHAYLSLRRSNNDLRIVAGKDTPSSGFTLLSLLKNELYFLPAFLSHYRRLGVQRFVFLNDNSDDGSVEYLLDQPDTVLVESDHSYGDTVSIPSSLPQITRNIRMMVLWRSLMHDMFADESWALQVDIDEFVHLPDGATFQDVTARLERENATAAWGVMLDMYPPDIGALRQQEREQHLDLSAAWYFDGEQHLRLRRRGRPKTVHPGARARLYHTYGATRLYPALGVKQLSFPKRVLRSSRIVRTPPKYNSLWKPALVHWSLRNHNYFSSSHYSDHLYSRELLLPIQHFRFSGAVMGKIQTGIKEGSYYNNSADHRLLAELFATMEKRHGSFLYKDSRLLTSFKDFVETCNVVGL